MEPLSKVQQGLRQHPWAGRPLVAEHEPLSQPALRVPVKLDQSLNHLLMSPSAAQAMMSFVRLQISFSTAAWFKAAC